MSMCVCVCARTLLCACVCVCVLYCLSLCVCFCFLKNLAEHWNLVFPTFWFFKLVNKRHPSLRPRWLHHDVILGGFNLDFKELPARKGTRWSPGGIQRMNLSVLFWLWSEALKNDLASPPLELSVFKHNRFGKALVRLSLDCHPVPCLLNPCFLNPVMDILKSLLFFDKKKNGFSSPGIIWISIHFHKLELFSHFPLRTTWSEIETEIHFLGSWSLCFLEVFFITWVHHPAAQLSLNVLTLVTLLWGMVHTGVYVLVAGKLSSVFPRSWMLPAH